MRVTKNGSLTYLLALTWRIHCSRSTRKFLGIIISTIKHNDNTWQANLNKHNCFSFQSSPFQVAFFLVRSECHKIFTLILVPAGVPTDKHRKGPCYRVPALHKWLHRKDRTLVKKNKVPVHPVLFISFFISAQRSDRFLYY